MRLLIQAGGDPLYAGAQKTTPFHAIHKLKHKALIALLKQNYSRQKYNAEKSKFDALDIELTDKVGVQKAKEMESDNSIPQVKIEQVLLPAIEGDGRQERQSPGKFDCQAAKPHETCLEIFNAHVAIKETKLNIEELEKVD